jgi:hypothetical protein
MPRREQTKRLKKADFVTSAAKTRKLNGSEYNHVLVIECFTLQKVFGGSVMKYYGGQ